jgi:hypothetical protein
MAKCIYRRAAKESKSFKPDREQQRCQADEGRPRSNLVGRIIGEEMILFAAANPGSIC